MSWEDIVKRNRETELMDEIASDFRTGSLGSLSNWASFFWDIGAIENTDMTQLWRFIEKPYNWQKEYELTNELMEALGEDDLGGLEEYMNKNQLYFFDQEKIKRHIQELKERKG